MTVWCVFEVYHDTGKRLQFIRSTEGAAKFEAFEERGMSEDFTMIEEWEVD